MAATALTSTLTGLDGARKIGGWAASSAASWMQRGANADGPK